MFYDTIFAAVVSLFKSINKIFPVCFGILFWAPYWLFQPFKWLVNRRTKKKKKKVIYFYLWKGTWGERPTVELTCVPPFQAVLVALYKTIFFKSYLKYQESQACSDRILKLASHLHLVSRLRIFGVLPLLYVFMAWRCSRDCVTISFGKSYILSTRSFGRKQ